MRTAFGFVVLALLVIRPGSIAIAGSQELDPTFVRGIGRRRGRDRPSG